MAFLTRRLAAVFVGVLAAASAGCLNFEKQTIFMLFSPERDELRAVLVYEGLFVSGDKQQDLKKAQDQLAGLYLTNQQFYVADPLFCFDLKGGKTDPTAGLLAKHLAIRNGEFFLNKEGKLSFSQTITVTNAKELVEAINASTSEAFAQFAAEGLAADRTKEKGRWELWDEESLRLIQKAAQEKHPWVRLEPGRISFTMVGSQALFARMKREMLAGEPPQLSPELIRFLCNTSWSLEERRNRVTISLGVGDGKPLRLPFERGKGDERFAKELLTHAKLLAGQFREDASADEVIAEFQKHASAKRR